MVELILIALLVIIAVGGALVDLRASREEVGKLKNDVEGKTEDVGHLKRSLKAFGRALGKPAATGTALMSRWRSRLPPSPDRAADRDDP